MPGFDELRDVSNFFTNELRRTSETFSAKTTRDLDDAVTKKIRDIKLFSSKLKLLQAKPLSSKSYHIKPLQLRSVQILTNIIKYAKVSLFVCLYAFGS